MKDISGIIMFDGFRIEKFQFDWDVSLEQIGINGYKYNIGYTGRVQKDKSKQIDLIIYLFDNNSKSFEDSPVKLELILAGKFHKADGTAWDQRWDSNALAILFPYARSIIASFTAQSGLETINLPTINTRSLIETNAILAEKPETVYQNK